MASSDYYKSEMRHIHAQIMDVQKKKEQHEKYAPKVSKLASSLGSVKSSMKDSEKFFSKGGYVSAGQTLSNGDILKDAKSLGEAKEILNGVVQKINLKIQEFGTKLIKLQNQYDEMKRAYDRAVKEENKKKK